MKVGVLGIFVALLLSACSTAQAPSPAGTRVSGSPVAARETATPVATPLAAPTPVSARPIQAPAASIDAGYIAGQLSIVETAIRLADTSASEYLDLGRHQQEMYHLLAAHKELVPAVLGLLPAGSRDAVQANLSAAQQIDSLNGTQSKLPHWRIVAPPAPSVLLGYYREAERTFGVQWPYLAAINLIETNMGRIQGLSSAGAQGPMQFMPATWASYGRGNVNDPHDAIMAAGRYLQAAGAQRDMSRAIYAYNNSALYVRAVTLYAQQMFANERTFLGYYNWQVFVPTSNGDVLLPEGFVN
jgi:Transglycosylase SLT domain